MLASELVLRAPEHIVAVGTDVRADPTIAAAGFDLADEAQVASLFREHGPFDGVIHAAAFTAVDLAEEREAEAKRVNEEACRVLASASAERAIPIVVVGTDFVFD